MIPTSLYPVLMSADVSAAAQFYRERLGFEAVYDSSWYVSLRLGDFELALLSYDHETVPAEYQKLPQGVILNLEVEDVDTVYRQLNEAEDLQVVLPLRSEDFGQRHFILEGPDHIMVDVIQPIEPTAEFAGSYVGQ